MTRSLKTLVSTLVGGTVLLSISATAFTAFAATTAKDTTAPSDVEQLAAKSGDSSVSLTWSAASDDVSVTGYKIYYGLNEVNDTNNATYSKTVTVGDVTKTTIKSLANGTKYYFAITALDAAKNESESYSPYTSATPIGAGGSLSGAVGGPDTIAPTVTESEALNKSQIRITFSEPIKLPALDADKAFIVQDNYTYESLKVKSVAADPEDTTGAAYILESEDQSPGSEYIVTASIDIEDLSGNPINSGTSDTAQFSGSSVTKEAYLKLHPIVAGTTPTATDATKEIDLHPAATAGFGIDEVVVENDTTIKVSFSKPAVYSLDPTENFEITKKGDSKAKLEFSSIIIDDNKKDVIITATMEAGEFYTVTVKDVVDTEGNALTTGKDTFDFTSSGGVSPVVDVTPPEDVTNFVASVVKNLGAKLRWTASKNAAGDLLEYALYESTDGKTFGPMTTLSKANTAFEAAELQPGYHYFKVTAKDATGNESAGKIVKIHLSETGPELGLIGLISVGLGRLFGKKKGKKGAKKVAKK